MVAGVLSRPPSHRARDRRDTSGGVSFMPRRILVHFGHQDVVYFGRKDLVHFGRKDVVQLRP